MSKFSGVIAKAVAVAEKVKADVIKAASDVEGVAVKLSADAPQIEAVVDAAVPGVSKLVPLGIAALEELASLLGGASAAAEQNLVNAGLDTALIADIKAALADIKKL
jgi:hypothetical protein